MAGARRRIWIHSFQTHLMLRTVCYPAVFLAGLGTALWAWNTVCVALEGTSEGQMAGMLAIPVICTFGLMLAAMIYDAVKFTHRFIGPLHRVRVTLRALADGKQVKPIKFRDGDYLSEVRDDFNAMLDTLQRRGANVLEAPAEKPPRPFDPTAAAKTHAPAQAQA